MLKRPRSARRSRHTAEADELIRLANGLAASSNMTEDRFWQHALELLINEILVSNEEETLNTALDALAKSDNRAWNELADVIESCCETRSFMLDGKEWQALLIAAPLLSWSRYAIPSGPLGREMTQLVRTHLCAHVLASGVKVGLADYLFSPDQLPQGYCNTTQLAEALTELAPRNGTLAFDPGQMPATNQFLSDTRYILAVVAAPKGEALFRWQEDDGSRSEAEAQWRKQGSSALHPLFAGCAFEPLLPLTYFAAWREADQASRAYAIRATVSFLQLALNVEPRQITAAIAPCHSRRLEEYRIGFMLRDSSDVIHGVVWPLLDGEDEQTDCFGQIEAVLRECGIANIVTHEHEFPLDYCDDCGAALYPNADGELMHTETPEEAPEQPRHLH
ncbi:MAG: hypothetical protein H6R07_744 [Proteobacteria bacterium]|nr:hypothetical protein [Pseudomonadota bacterium]